MPLTREILRERKALDPAPQIGEVRRVAGGTSEINRQEDALRRIDRPRIGGDGERHAAALGREKRDTEKQRGDHGVFLSITAPSADRDFSTLT